MTSGHSPWAQTADEANPAGRTRADGPAKLTGSARYTADEPATGALGVTHAVLVTSSIASGRISRIRTTAAGNAPGVVAVISHLNAPRLHPVTHEFYPHGLLPLQDDRVHYEGAPIAVVVAERREQAVEAAALIEITYTPEPAITDLADALRRVAAENPTALDPVSVGDVDGELARADLVLERVYTTAPRHHVPLEPSATLAEWSAAEGTLLLHDSTQSSFEVREVVAGVLGLAESQVRVITRYVGGGFGGKGHVWPHQIIAAMTARATGRAVRLVLTRAQTFTAHGYQPPTRQRITLGATAEGSLTALRHTSVNTTAAYADHVELAAAGSRTLYACAAIETGHRATPVATVLPVPMRAPREGMGIFALESAMDELAYQVGVDPLRLRLRNHADVDPMLGLPFSSKELRACYAEGAQRFGWAERPMAPRSLHEGEELIGWGMASAVMTTFRMPATVRLRIDTAGRVLVEAGTHEIGTGTSTIIPQIAAAALHCAPDRVRLRLGDTTLPRTGMTIGSSTTLSVGSATHIAARALLGKLASMAARHDGTWPLPVVGIEGRDLVLEGGSARVSLPKLLARAGVDEVTAEGCWSPGAEEERFSMHSYGAVFAEVRVDAQLCTTRVERLTGVYSAGRIINPRTAHSQMIGGLTWGIGQALVEQSAVDPLLGRFSSKNLSDYLVPVNADVRTLDVSFVDEDDPVAGLIGGRGIGELGAVGVSAAIANAVYHATGIRVRDLPITPAALLSTPGPDPWV